MTAPRGELVTFDTSSWDGCANPLEAARATMGEFDRLKIAREVALIALTLAEQYGAPGEIIARLRRIANQNEAPCRR